MTDTTPTATQREGNVDAVRLLTWQKQRPYGAQPLDAEMLGYLRSMLDSHDAPNVIIDDQTVPVFRLYEVLDRIAALEAENVRLQHNNQRLHEELDAERRSFPGDGVFLSQTTRGGWSYTKIAELDEPDPAGLARVARHTDLIARAILRVREQAEGYVPSAYTEATAIVQALREALAEGSGE